MGPPRREGVRTQTLGLGRVGRLATPTAFHPSQGQAGLGAELEEALEVEPHPAEEGIAPPSMSWDIVGGFTFRQKALHPRSSAAAGAGADKQSVSFA